MKPGSSMTALAMQYRRIGPALVAAAMVTFVTAGPRPPSVYAQDLTNKQFAGKAKMPVFEADLKLLLQAKCVRCHGEKARKADLDLRTRAGIVKGSESGPVIVAGKPAESKLYQMVHEGKMPPGKKDKLSKAEVEIVRRWIESGACFGTESLESDLALTQHDVIPILLRGCTVCHGRNQREAGLDLRTKASMLRGGKSGPAIVPGKPEESLLLKKVRSGDMPPRRRIIEVSVKPIEPAEIDMLAKWIAAGAPEVPIQPDVATNEPDPLVTDKDRAFWAFQPPRAVVPPEVKTEGRVRNPIDAFVLHKLEAAGLTLSPDADRLTLLRRACFDLTGLPPEPEEVRAFLDDRDPLAYEKVIDRLLASPRYGERWGRHWLDLAGYADTEGKREQDILRPFAWRYRDYVIRSFNADKPYDRFLLEQIAGDELVDYERAPQITEEMCDNLVATGFLRMAPDPTWYNLTNFLPDRIDVIADEMDVLGSAVLGLTLKCARCHSHKFDPIPQRDYYRMLDVFKGAFDEHDWMKSNWHVPLSMGPRTDRDLTQVSTAERKQWEAQNARLQNGINELKKARNKQSSPEVDRKIKELESKRPPEPKIRALWDRGEPSPTYILRRGDYLSPGRLVGPGVASVLTDGKTPFEVQPPWPRAKQTGRRLAFARWLTKPDHPLTARVLVNRVWKHHFGTGIVKTLDNFGKAGTQPTHPELLDWLGVEFVRQGWSLKALHRMMMTSATYRQSSAVTPTQERLDPDNTLLSRMPLTRLDAESLYDTMLLLAGRLDEKRHGPADALEVRGDGLVTPKGTDRGWRRMIYVQVQRKLVATHLENFDFPQMNPNCIERRDSTVAPQALHLMNNGMVQRLAEEFARRVRRHAGTDPARQVEWAYLIALSRPPSGEEKQLGMRVLAELAAVWIKQPSDADAAELRALTTYCHTILNSAAFLFVD
jgi:mono/diheme cytochrome c family protein